MNQYVWLWLDTLREQLPEHWQSPRVLEIGSYSFGPPAAYGVREKFPGADYIGIDVTEGANVDIAMNAHDLLFADGRFDVVLCLEMLEHDSDMGATIGEAHRVLRDRGLFIFTTMQQNHPVHPPAHDVDKAELLGYLAPFQRCYLEVFLKDRLHGWAVK